MGKIIVAPSILAAKFDSLASEIKSIEDAGGDWLHIDVMDGSFVPPITFGDNMVRIAKANSSLFCDVHLMINDPNAHLESFKDAGSDRIIVHQEVCTHLHRTLSKIRSLGMSAGVALNPATPVNTIFDVLAICDLVLIMTVNPGWGGQPFISQSIEKIEALQQQIEKRKLKTIIEVDGGINQLTGTQCIKAGATALVSGSYIFAADNRAEAIKSLRQS